MMLAGWKRSLKAFLEAQVLLAQALLLLGHFLPEAHRLGDHGADHRQQAHVLFQADGVGEQAVGAERAHHLVAQLDGHADEGDVVLVQLGARPGAVQEVGLLVDVLHHHGPARLHHLAGDALAELVAAALALLGAEAVGRLDQ